MNSNNPNRIYAVLGLAGEAGCLSVVLAIGALLLGLWLDHVLNTRRIAAIVCVVGSVPINLFITLRLTQRLVARVIPQGTLVNKSAPPKADTPDSTVGDSE